jgi:hypothetical protein
MNHLQLKDILIWLVFGSFTLWPYGCTSWKEVANLSEVKREAIELCTSNRKTIAVKAIHGCTYLLRTWRFDGSNNIIGKGVKKEGVAYKPFSGILFADSIAAQIEILVTTKSDTEYVLQEWTNRGNGDIFGRGYELVHSQIQQFDEYTTIESQSQFDGGIYADSIATVKHLVYDPAVTRSVIIVGAVVGAVAISFWIANWPIFNSTTF